MSKRTSFILSSTVCFVLALFFGVLCVINLRANNLQAVKLRNQVLEVDKANGDVETALRDLRSYVYTHMNTDLSASTNVYPPVQLKYRYDRLVAAEKERVAAVMAKVYTDAQAECERQNSTDFSGRNRIPCIEAYVTARTISEQPINEDLYKFDFASPAWTPDFAGITMVLSGAFAFLGVSVVLLQQWLRNRLF